MRYVVWVLGFFFLLGNLGCYLGTDPRKSEVATSQYGARIQFQFDTPEEYPEAWFGEPVRIELLAVRDRGLLVEDGGSIWLFRFGSFKKAQFFDGSEAKDLEKNPPLPDRLEMARLLSRYPYGLTDDQLASLLADRGQDAVIVR